MNREMGIFERTRRHRKKALLWKREIQRTFVVKSVHRTRRSGEREEAGWVGRKWKGETESLGFSGKERAYFPPYL